MIKNNTIVTEFKFYLYPEEENEIDLKKVFQNKDGDIVLVEIISTQFKKIMVVMMGIFDTGENILTTKITYYQPHIQCHYHIMIYF